MNWLLFFFFLWSQVCCVEQSGQWASRLALYSQAVVSSFDPIFSRLRSLAFNLCFLRSPSTKSSVMNNLYTNVRPRIPRGRLGCVASVGAKDAVIDASTSSAVVPDFYFNKEEWCEVWFQRTRSRSLSWFVCTTLHFSLCEWDCCLCGGDWENFLKRSFFCLTCGDHTY